MFTDRLLVFLGGLVAPLAGLGVRASRRNRLLGRIRTYSDLANELEPKDAGSAALLRELATENVQWLAKTDRAARGRQFEPSTLVAYLLFLSPAVVGLVVALPPQAWWDWLVIGASVLWVLVVIAAAWEAIAPKDEQGSTTAATPSP